MPRVFWMKPGQTLFVGGLMRIDLLEVKMYIKSNLKKIFNLVFFLKSTKDERVLFTIMASPALPIINPFDTIEADSRYQKYYEEGNILRVSVFEFNF